MPLIYNDPQFIFQGIGRLIILIAVLGGLGSIILSLIKRRFLKKSFIIFLIIGLVGGIVYFLPRFINTGLYNSGENQSGGNIPGEIAIIFKENTSLPQALNLFIKYGLNYDEKGYNYKLLTYNFYTHEKLDRAYEIVDRLKKNLKVDSAEVILGDGKTVTAINVNFKFNVTESEARKTALSEGLDGALWKNRIASLKVPVGQEQYYVDEMKKSPFVEDAFWGQQRAPQN